VSISSSMQIGDNTQLMDRNIATPVFALGTGVVAVLAGKVSNSVIHNEMCTLCEV
jgi:hypothetical protein